MSVVLGYAMPHPPLIIPEVGLGEEKGIKKTIIAYEQAARQIAEAEPDTIVVISPHSILYADYIHVSKGEGASGDFGEYGAPDVIIDADYDTEAVGLLEKLCQDQNFPAGTLGEKNPDLDHGTMIPLYFINRYYQDYKIIRVSISGLTLEQHYQMGMLIRGTMEALNRKAVIIASGDLSHRLMDEGPYTYAKEGPEFDEIVTRALKEADFYEMMHLSETFCNKAGECGLRSFVMLGGAFDKVAVNTNLMSYEGPFGVGYAVCAFYPKKEDASRDFLKQITDKRNAELRKIQKREDIYVRLARKALESFLEEKKMLEVPVELPEEMIQQKAGVFVSLKKNGQLRGCIGTISPAQGSIAEEIIQNAVSAAVSDFRFPPVEKEELPFLQMSVDVLGEPEQIASEAELDVKRFGVIVSANGKRGLLLPNLEGVDTIDEQISIALEKARIRPSEIYTLERFEVVRHK